MTTLEAHATRIAVLEAQHEQHRSDIDQLTEAIRWLTRAIFGFMLTIVAGVIVAVVVTQGGGVG